MGRNFIIHDANASGHAKAGSNCFQFATGAMEEFHGFPTRGLALSALGPCTLLLRTFGTSQALAPVRIWNLDTTFSSSRICGALFVQYLVRQWICVPGLFLVGFPVFSS